MTAPAQDWAEKAREIIGDRCCCQTGFTAFCRDCIARRECALALSDAARTGREEGLEEAEGEIASYLRLFDGGTVYYHVNALLSKVRALKVKP